MLDTMGPALQVCNKSGNPIELMAGNHVTITPDVTREPSAEILPVNYSGLANVSFQFHPLMLFFHPLMLFFFGISCHPCLQFTLFSCSLPIHYCGHKRFGSSVPINKHPSCKAL